MVLLGGVFFGLKNPVSVALFVTFLVGTTLYAYPWLVGNAAS